MGALRCDKLNFHRSGQKYFQKMDLYNFAWLTRKPDKHMQARLTMPTRPSWSHSLLWVTSSSTLTTSKLGLRFHFCLVSPWCKMCGCLTDTVCTRRCLRVCLCVGRCVGVWCIYVWVCLCVVHLCVGVFVCGAFMCVCVPLCICVCVCLYICWCLLVVFWCQLYLALLYF